MIPLKRILVVVDPTATAQPAVERAAWLAKQLPSRVELFICDYSAALVEGFGTDAATLAAARKRFLAEHVRRLRTIAQPLVEAGLLVEVDARWDSPLHEGIVRKAIETNADLVLKDTHYVAPLRRSLFSNTDWNLIRACPTTLWLVKSRATAAKPCIVAAVDPLHEHDKPAALDAKIVATAQELVVAAKGELHLFHGVDMTPLLAASGDALSIPAPLPLYDMMEMVRTEHEKAVRSLANSHGIPADRVHIEQGVRQSLLDLTDGLRADVVVMGVISRSGLKRLCIGNTAEEVLDRLTCDLVLVKPDAVPPDAG